VERGYRDDNRKMEWKEVTGMTIGRQSGKMERLSDPILLG